MLKKTFIIFSIIVFFLLIYLKFFKQKQIVEVPADPDNETTYNSNILEDVEYISKDSKGNEYIIRASKGEIDFNNNDIIFLTNVRSLIKLTNADEINIDSDFGKYNASNYDTIFSKNVIITYLDNKIEGEYLDFSLIKNKMIISKNVVFTNLENILRADVIEMQVDTKDTKIFMYEKDKKVNIKNKNY